jgi:hypothetical protein
MKRILSLILLCPFALSAMQEKLTSTASLIDTQTKATIASCSMSWHIEGQSTFTPDDNAQKIIKEWDEHGAFRGDFEGYELLLKPEFFDFFRNKAMVQAHAHFIKRTNDRAYAYYRRPNLKDLRSGESSTDNLFEQGHPDGANSPWYTLALVITHLIE